MGRADGGEEQATQIPKDLGPRTPKPHKTPCFARLVAFKHVPYTNPGPFKGSPVLYEVSRASSLRQGLLAHLGPAKQLQESEDCVNDHAEAGSREVLSPQSAHQRLWI